MPTFKQKNVIKSYKLRLQEKLKSVSEETENATTFLNNCVEEFSKRVQHILEIKDEKCLSLYRKLSRDLEDYSEKLFILQGSLEEVTDEESTSDEEEISAALPKSLPKTSSFSSQKENSLSDSCSKENVNSNIYENVPSLKCTEENVNQSKCAGRSVDRLVCLDSVNKHRYQKKCRNQHSNKENVNKYWRTEGSVNQSTFSEKSVNQQRESEENVSFSDYLEKNKNQQAYSKESINQRQYPESNTNQGKNCQDEDAGSMTEDDFYSLHSDSNAQKTNSCTLFTQLPIYPSGFLSENEYQSNVSMSESSCYRSISSNISEASAFHKENKNNQFASHSMRSRNVFSLEIQETSLKMIHPAEVASSNFSATLSHIKDPGDFWIQLENSSKLSFPKSEYDLQKNLTSIQIGSFCLAPFRSTPFYYRAQSLSNGTSGSLVKVLFIDHGSTREIFLCDLKPLPESAYEISAQAIHCYLHGIEPLKDSWSSECTERFKDFQNFCIEAFVKTKENLYGVQLIAKLSADLDEDFSVDIAQALCLDGLALSLNESSSHDISHTQLDAPQLSKSLSNKTDLASDVSGLYDTNTISCDSGVSVTSAYKSSQISNIRNEIFHKVSGDYFSPVSAKNEVLLHKENLLDFRDKHINDLILFESSDALNLQNSNAFNSSDDSAVSCCLLCKNRNFCLHLTVPAPSLSFVEKDMMIVMLSHIVNPQEFYVNMAIENIVSLDDLREQMICVYESEKNVPKVKISDVAEQMYCAARFYDDKFWYRAKILKIKENRRNEILVQYIDYGNTAIIQCRDLKPLAPDFAKHPSFAIKCSLAGISPMTNATSNNSVSCWNDDAISAFEKLVSFERCLTAQICKELCTSQSDSYPVLLWDTDNSKDLLINTALADQKVAIFTYNHLSSSLSSGNTEQPALDSWDPMSEEYCDIDNNYAVDEDDIEVKISGHRAKDESYICKYFALNGYCPRGANCTLKHLPMLESGITRDQEEVYCLDPVPLISENVNNTLVQVSAIISPSHFYVVLPFGCKTVDDIDNLVYRGSSYNQIINSEAKDLFHAIDKHYSRAPFKENTKIALSCGTIVAAKRKWDDKWHRGRIVDVIDIHKPAKVFFVDSGDHEWVSRQCIRTILPQFLHTPFQAVQCSLYGIEPVESEKDMSWSSEALNYFKDLVAGEILLAEIIHRFENVFHVSLRKTSHNNHKSLTQLLVAAKFAQYQEIIHSDKKETIYVPG